MKLSIDLDNESMFFICALIGVIVITVLSCNYYSKQSELEAQRAAFHPLTK